MRATMIDAPSLQIHLRLRFDVTGIDKADVITPKRKRRRMVGAAGFEPATWSTQNSRATRLRYAPPHESLTRAGAVRYTLHLQPASSAQRRNNGCATRSPAAI